MNILSVNYHNYFVTKKSLSNIPYRNLSLNCKQDSKIRKERVLRGPKIFFAKPEKKFNTRCL